MKSEAATIYIADDGAQFFTEDSCKSYELALLRDEEEREIMDYLRETGLPAFVRMSATDLRQLASALLDGFIMHRITDPKDQ